MQTDPLLLSWHRNNVEWLEGFAYKMNGPIDIAAAGVGITPEDLQRFRAEIPRLCSIARGLLSGAPVLDKAEASVAARILAKTAPEFNGCQRWLGSVQSERKRADGKRTGTPVIGYLGKTTPARRLAWQLRYRGTPDALTADDRLRNIGCTEASMCMNLTHWYKPNKGPDMGTVRRTLASLPPVKDGRLCSAKLHFIPRDKASCPACRSVSAYKREDATEAARDVGVALRMSLSRHLSRQAASEVASDA